MNIRNNLGIKTSKTGSPHNIKCRFLYSFKIYHMLYLLKWMPIHKRLLYNRAILTYKALNGLAPEYITIMLTPKSQVQDRPLRSSVDGIINGTKVAHLFV